MISSEVGQVMALMGGMSEVNRVMSRWLWGEVMMGSWPWEVRSWVTIANAVLLIESL